MNNKLLGEKDILISLTLNLVMNSSSEKNASIVIQQLCVLTGIQLTVHINSHRKMARTAV